MTNIMNQLDSTVETIKTTLADVQARLAQSGMGKLLVYAALAYVLVLTVKSVFARKGA